LSLLAGALPPNAVKGSQLGDHEHGEVLEVVGLVVARQRPRTAKGFVFILMGDETGMTNVIVHPDVYERDRLAIRGEPFLWVRGKLAKDDGTLNVMRRKCEDWVFGRPTVRRYGGTKLPSKGSHVPPFRRPSPLPPRRGAGFEGLGVVPPVARRSPGASCAQRSDRLEDQIGTSVQVGPPHFEARFGLDKPVRRDAIGVVALERKDEQPILSSNDGAAGVEVEWFPTNPWLAVLHTVTAPPRS
jgi:hypothetical protein